MVGGYAMDKINVLWMNNGDEELLQYVELGKTFNLVITTCNCMTDCRHYLDDRSVCWDAVILNAEIKTTPNEKPSVNHLYQAADDVKARKVLSWFIVTTKELRNKAAIRGVLPPKERFYNIKTEYRDLFEVIRIKVNNSPQNFVLEKYADVCSFCNHPDLKSLLEKLEFSENDLDSDTSIPNTCRGLLEWLETSTVFKKYNYSYKRISQELDNKRRSEVKNNKTSEITIPPHITRSFHFCCEVTNDGSHEMLLTKKLIREGEAPYLNKSLILNLLNILRWCASLDLNSFELL